VTTPTTREARAGVFHPRYLLLSISLLALITVIAFEGMAVSTAMPDAARELDAVRSYGLAFSVMLTTQLLGIVLAGVWCDRSGPLPSLFAGQLLFAVGCAGCGSAQSFGPFLAGRGVAGLGAGLIIVAGYVVIGRAYPESLRPKVFSVISAAWVLPSLLGPPIAAWVTTTWSWRWVFWLVVLPVVVAFAMVLARRGQIASASKGVAHSGRDRRQHARAAWFGVLIAASAGALQWGTHDLELTWSTKTVVASTW
jgi:MFS family permease